MIIVLVVYNEGGPLIIAGNSGLRSSCLHHFTEMQAQQIDSAEASPAHMQAAGSGSCSDTSVSPLGGGRQMDMPLRTVLVQPIPELQKKIKGRIVSQTGNFLIY